MCHISLGLLGGKRKTLCASVAKSPKLDHPLTTQHPTHATLSTTRTLTTPYPAAQPHDILILVTQKMFRSIMTLVENSQLRPSLFGDFTFKKIFPLNIRTNVKLRALDLTRCSR